MQDYESIPKKNRNHLALHKGHLTNNMQQQSQQSDDESDRYGDDFPSMFMKLFEKINIKIGFFIFILGILLFSDVFIKNILSNFTEATDSLGYPTTHGTIILLLLLVIGYIIIDLLVQGGYI